MENIIDFLKEYIEFIVLPFAYLIALIFAKKKNKKLRDLMNEIAIRKNGRVLKGSIFRPPRLLIEYDGKEIVFGARGGGDKNLDNTYAEGEFNFPVEFKLHIFRQRVGGKLAKSFGMQDIDLGNFNFDNEFIVKCSREHIVRSLLSDDLQQRLLEYLHNNPVIKVKNNKFSFIINQYPTDLQIFEKFIDTTLLFIDKLRMVY